MPKSGFLSKIGSSMYGISEGLLDTVSFGLTDTMTDKLWTDVVNKKGAENLSQFRGAGNMAGALGGAILTGNVSGAIEEGLEGFGSIAANSQNEKFQKVEQFANMGAQLSSLASGANKFTNFGAKMGNIASMPQVSQSVGQINSLLTSQPKMPSTNVPKDVVYSSKQSTNYADGGPVKPRPIFVSNRNDPRLRRYNDSLTLYNSNYEPPTSRNSYPITPYELQQLINYRNSSEFVRPIRAQYFSDEGYRSDLAFYNANLLSRRSGIMPNRAFYVEGFAPAYKKPVQPIKYADPKIVEKQKQLKEAGLYSGDLDGVWGKDSKKAWETYTTSKAAEPTTPITETVSTTETPSAPVATVPKIKNIWGEQIYTPNTDVYNIAQKRKDGQLYDHRYVIEQEDGSLIELPNAEQYKRYKEKYGLGNDLPVKYGRMPYFNSTPVITTFEDGGPVKPGLSATRIMPMNPQQVQQMIRQNQQPQLTAQQLMMQRLAADNARRFNTTESTRTIQQYVSPEERAYAAANNEAAQQERRLADAAAANEESLLTSDNWQQLLARQTQAIGDKLDVPFLPNWIDPLYAIGSMASGLGAAPYNIQQGNYGSAAWGIAAPIVTGGLASIGAKTTGQFLNNAFNPVAGVGTNTVSKNLDDLKYAQKFAKQYGYDIPKNLERISKSDELTNRTIRGLMNRHNSFVRGVSTNWDEIKKKNPDILRHLEDLGIDYKNNPRAAAEYMATHIPGQTGYGRYGLKPNEDAIYLSNSYPTAEGYTYGQGFMVKVKRPTDFSSSNRKDWIDYNKFTASKGFRNSKLGEGIVKTDYIKRVPITMRDFIVSTGDPNKINTLLKNATEIENLYKDLRRKARYRYDDKIENFRSKVDANFRVRDNRFLDDLPVVIRDSPNILDKTKLSYLKSAQYLTDAYYDFNVNAKPIASVLKGIYGDPDVWKAVGKNLIGNVDPFSHYVIKGEPGQKVLDAVNFKQITPEIWSNKSRGHINVSSKGLTRYKKGGMIKRADGSYSKRGLWDAN